MGDLTFTGAFCHSGGSDWQRVDPGVERKLLAYDAALMMVCVRFETGAIGTLHHHEHRQVTYIQSGRFEVTIDGQSRVLAAGDCFFVQSNLMHGVVALEPGVLVDVFAPAREDFLASKEP